MKKHCYSKILIFELLLKEEVVGEYVPAIFPLLLKEKLVGGHVRATNTVSPWLYWSLYWIECAHM